MARYVVVKGRFGIGGRLAVLLSAYRYAQAAGRKLIVDWNDFSYWEPGSPDLFPSLFDEPVSVDIPLRELSDLHTFPDEWQGHVDRYSGTDVDTIMPYELSFATVPEPDDTAAAEADVVVVTRNDYPPTLATLYSELRLSGDLRTRLAAHRRLLRPDLRIGVQVRHGNGERMLEPPDMSWFHAQLDDDAGSLFVCSDSPDVVTEFEDRYPDVAHTTKWYPPPGNGSLHQNDTCPDRVENARAALLDIWLLGACRRLVISPGFFGETARRLAGPEVDVVQYPGRIHATREEKLAAGWTNPI